MTKARWIAPILLLSIFLFGLVGQEVVINGGIEPSLTDNQTRDNVSAIATSLTTGIPIISAKSTWQVVHTQTTSADNTSVLDNSSLIDFGSKNAAVVIGSFLFDNATATIKCYGFASATDNKCAYLGKLVIAADNTSVGGRYMSTEAAFDIKGYRYCKFLLDSFVKTTGDNVTLYGMGY